MPSLRIVLAEDQALVRGALAALLRLEADFDVVAEVGDGRAGLEAVTALRPDILLTDIEMPLMTGLELAQAVRTRGLPTRVVIVTTFGRAGYLHRAMSAGVGGYLLKDAPSEQLAAAIRRVASGGRAIDPELALAGWDGDDPLTDRERQVLRLAGEGKTSGEIASLIHLSEGTVRNYLSEAIGKLGAANRIEAARLARDKGWL
ncbi:DNA-binding response regulator [Chitinimonas sp. BJYL2]|uniref:response regulator transcription factor n=1 Tax=Chitinimonas sp. BJYL2 TaxID=2976696 RepID=UPI0022B5DA0E|nr:response regulator transcription factor [Chitinimonas sp. BJYL2]